MSDIERPTKSDFSDFSADICRFDGIPFSANLSKSIQNTGSEKTEDVCVLIMQFCFIDPINQILERSQIC